VVSTPHSSSKLLYIDLVSFYWRKGRYCVIITILSDTLSYINLYLGFWLGSMKYKESSDLLISNKKDGFELLV
jgi:hypothetical protein